jgi:parvulin-like peptidyl-prolyl isomerase
VSQILVGSPEEAEEASALLKTRGWAWVASRYSIDASGKRGGDLGYLTKGNMIPELEAIVFDMKPNEVSGVIKSDFGYHLFRLEDVREALIPVGLEDVREQIMNTIMLEKRKNAYREFLDSLRAEADITYRDDSYERPAGRGMPEDAGEIRGDADTASAP